jgi:hypothetical protein
MQASHPQRIAALIQTAATRARQRTWYHKPKGPSWPLYLNQLPDPDLDSWRAGAFTLTRRPTWQLGSSSSSTWTQLQDRPKSVMLFDVNLSSTVCVLASLQHATQCM